MSVVARCGAYGQNREDVAELVGHGSVSQRKQALFVRTENGGGPARPSLSDEIRLEPSHQVAARSGRLLTERAEAYAAAAAEAAAARRQAAAALEAAVKEAESEAAERMLEAQAEHDSAVKAAEQKVEAARAAFEDAKGLTPASQRESVLHKMAAKHGALFSA
jgi:hypothetical protein